MIKKYPIQLTVNDEVYDLMVDPRKSLLKLLREDLDLTGTHIGCDTTSCGACTVLVDGSAERACLMEIGDVANSKLTTIEGLAKDDVLHPVQQALIDNHGSQCGFCTPGMILRTVAFLRRHPHPTDGEIARSIEGNLCRCTGYVKIQDAIRRAAAESGRGG